MALFGLFGHKEKAGATGPEAPAPAPMGESPVVGPGEPTIPPVPKPMDVAPPPASEPAPTTPAQPETPTTPLPESGDLPNAA